MGDMLFSMSSYLRLKQWFPPRPLGSNTPVGDERKALGAVGNVLKKKNEIVNVNLGFTTFQKVVSS